MIKAKYQYRVTKKGCECFRSDVYEEVKEKFLQLTGGKPSTKYAIQHRSCRYDSHDRDVLDRDYLGRLNWSPWFNC